MREAVLVSRWYLSPNSMTVNYAPAWKTLRGGRFELHGCDPASSAPVLFVDAKKQRGAAVELSGKQAGEDVEVKMQPCGSATVRLVDDQGKPVRRGATPAHIEVVLTPGPSFAEIIIGRPEDEPGHRRRHHVANLDRERYRDHEDRRRRPDDLPDADPRRDVPGLVYNQPVKTQIEFTVRPGEMKDLGDLKIRNLEHAG